MPDQKAGQSHWQWKDWGSFPLS